MEEGFFLDINIYYSFCNIEINSFFSISHSNLFLFKSRFESFQFLRRSTVEAIQGLLWERKGCIFTERAKRFKILILEDELGEDSSWLRFLFVSSFFVEDEVENGGRIFFCNVEISSFLLLTRI